MLASHAAVAWRQIVTQPLYSAINVAGLAIGLACSILIALFVHYELSYDRHYARAERIYRISRDYLPSDRSSELHPAGIAGPVAPLLAADFPQIEKAARIFCCGGVAKTPDGDAVLHRGYAMADPELFEIFDFTWLAGDPRTALDGPYDVVLTRSAARRHFGDRDPLGQTLLLGGGNGEWESLRVTGVIEDPPDNTTLAFDMLQSMAAWSVDPAAQRYLNDWRNDVFHTYVLLREGADIAAIQRGAADFFERRFEAGASAYTSFAAMPLTDIHLHADRDGEMAGRDGAAGNIRALYAFGAIAVFVLLVACINFTNLATARATQRAKEIGVRKVVGASRGKLVSQFLVESIVLAFVAVLLAVVLVELALPPFEAFLGKDLAFEYSSDPRVWAALAALALLTGVLAGSYPAFYLSAFEPVGVLKGETAQRGRAAFRKALVTLQFAISIALLIATAVVYRQMQLAHGIELGLNKEQIVVVSPNNVEGAQWETLRREWLSHPEITHVTRSDRVPFEPNGRTAEIRGADPARHTARMPFLTVDYDFFETYEIAVVAGRTFSPQFADQPTLPPQPGPPIGAPFVLSELAARELGWTPEEAVGQWLELTDVQGSRFRVDEARGPIVGVVADAHFQSIHDALEPMIYVPGPTGAASLRLTGRDVEATLAHIDAVWRRFRPDLPATRRFLDQTFDELYRTEERQGSLITAFAAFAMLIACLGVFGLVSFATEKRTKEIGIRKVMGGGTIDIVALFGGELARLVLLANAIAWPVAYVLMRRWLEPFAYRIELGPALFAGAGLLALAVALATVAVVAARAAAANPLRSLRHE